MGVEAEEDDTAKTEKLGRSILVRIKDTDTILCEATKKKKKKAEDAGHTYPDVAYPHY